MASLITLPANELNAIIRGDVDILAGYEASNGTGTMHIRSGGLYVEGLTDLDQTTITTSDGKFHVLGTNKIEFNVSGGATSSIEMTAEDTSFFSTTAGTLSLNATATDANGKINLTAAGTGTDSILINATNTTSGQVTIQSASAHVASDSIRLIASDTTGGNVSITGAGSTTPAVLVTATSSSGQVLVSSAGTAADAIEVATSAGGITVDANTKLVLQAAGTGTDSILINATNATSGQVTIQSAGGDGTDAIKILASDATGGNVSITGAGAGQAVLIDATSATGAILVSSAGTTDAIKLLASDDTAGQIVIEADGNVANAIRITADNATAGGIDIDATGLIAIDTTSTASGITIATATAGVPVVVGTSTSAVSVPGNVVVGGNLTVSGTTTTIDTQTLTIEDNIILINSGPLALGLDGGLVIRRSQTANDAGAGEVVNGPNPIQESGAFQTGSATPGSLKLAAHASNTPNFYSGWWIKMGTQVRRIKSYDESTKTATIWVTSENTVTPYFNDGLDLASAPLAGDPYTLYSDAYQMSFYDESLDKWTFANVTLEPTGANEAVIQQYQQINTGAIDVKAQVYRNVSGSASTNTITFTLIGHGITAGDLIELSDSATFIPAITPQFYTVNTVPTADTFTITAPASTTSDSASSATIKLLHTSSISVNVIQPSDPNFPINIPTVAVYEDIPIGKTSTTLTDVTSTAVAGSFLLLVSDIDTTGAHAVFIGSRSAGGNYGTITRLSSARGADGQRIDAEWTDGELIQIRHKPAGSGGGSYTYRVRIYSAL